MPAPWPQTKEFKKYRELEFLLRVYINQSRDEDQEAEEIRSKMDKLWFKMPEEERRWINRNVRLPKI